MNNPFFIIKENIENHVYKTFWPMSDNFSDVGLLNIRHFMQGGMGGHPLKIIEIGCSVRHYLTFEMLLLCGFFKLFYISCGCTVYVILHKMTDQMGSYVRRFPFYVSFV